MLAVVIVWKYICSDTYFVKNALYQDQILFETYFVVDVFSIKYFRRNYTSLETYFYRNLSDFLKKYFLCATLYLYIHISPHPTIAFVLSLVNILCFCWITS
jgi:hypothetical protein